MIESSSVIVPQSVYTPLEEAVQELALRRTAAPAPANYLEEALACRSSTVLWRWMAAPNHESERFLEL